MKKTLAILSVVLLLVSCSYEKINSDNMESFISSIIRKNMNYLNSGINDYRYAVSSCSDSDNRICFLVCKRRCYGDNLCYAIIYSTMEAEKDLKTYRVADSLYIAFEDQYKNDSLKDVNRNICCSKSIIYEDGIKLITTPSFKKSRVVYCHGGCDLDEIIQFRDFPNESDNNDCVIEDAQIDDSIESDMEDMTNGGDDYPDEYESGADDAME